MEYMNKILLALAIKFDNNHRLIYEHIKNKIALPKEEIDSLTRNQSKNTTTIISENYPEQLKRMFQPPFVIYYEGNLDSLNNPHVFVYRDNDLSIPLENVIYVNSANEIVIGTNLTIKINDDRFLANRIAVVLSNVVYMSDVPENDNNMTKTIVGCVLDNDKELGVKPTFVPSQANVLIKEGANLVDSLEDLEDLLWEL